MKFAPRIFKINIGNVKGLRTQSCRTHTMSFALAFCQTPHPFPQESPPQKSPKTKTKCSFLQTRSCPAPHPRHSAHTDKTPQPQIRNCSTPIGCLNSSPIQNTPALRLNPTNPHAPRCLTNHPNPCCGTKTNSA